YRRDTGTDTVAGREAHKVSPRAMREKGISVIYQEIMLAPDLAVIANLFLDRLHQGRPYISSRALEKRALAVLDSIGFGHIDPRRTVGELTVAEQQIVEICKALVASPRVIVLDEPTAVLTVSESRNLLALVRKLKR